MTKRQKEMAAIKEEISKLEKRLEYLSKLPDTNIEDELLCSFDDFPWIVEIVRAIYVQTKDRFYMDELTVKDLISCKEETIASYRGVGKDRMKALKNWMESYDLHFVG